MKPELLWPRNEFVGALVSLASATGLAEGAGESPLPSYGTAGAGGLATVATSLGLDLQSATHERGGTGRRLRGMAPALVDLPGGDGVVALVSAGRRRARVVVPGGAVVAVPTEELAQSLTGSDGDAPPPTAWLVRPSPGSSFWRQFRRAGLPGRLGALILAHAAEYAFFLWSWAILGRAAFAGRIEGGTLLEWAALLAASVPARVVATRLQANVAIGAGWLLRRRLLHGTLRLRADEIRREGAGQLLGRSLEAEAVEDLAIGGGLLGVLAAVEVTMAVIVLAAGPGPLLAGLLLGWLGLTLGAAHRYVQRRRAWAAARMVITHDLIEKMVGHRTRLAQQAAERWHEGEEERLAGYAGLARNMDRWLSALLALAPRGWVIVGLAGLGVEVAAGASSADVAVGAGGILLALSALTRLVNGLAQVADAAVAWSQVAPLFDAAARGAGPRPTSAVDGPTDGIGVPSALVEAENLAYHYDGRGVPALSGCSLRIRSGDRLLLEGSSGSGKSTLAALLAGLRQPTGGRLLLEGSDHESVGVTAWRHAVVASPQFHENHVVLGPLLFNLLIGRRWPPRPEDVQEAYELCVALGLGPMLEKMPSGLQQMVGDTGWQLSHGERSLVFLGRALLQRSRLVLLDETFGSLDPETMQRALRVALERAETLVVIRQ